MIKKIIIPTLLLSSILFAQSDVSLNINNEDLEARAAFNLNSTVGYTGGTSYLLDASYLHNDKDDLFTVGLSGENSLEAAPGLVFGFGFKAAFAEDFMAFPLLGKVRYILPFDSDIPTTSFLASYAYAPSVLTFLDGDSYSELRLEGDVEVISNIHIFGGYRNIDTDYERNDYKINDSWYGGLKLSF
ncbi:hypothetical protein MNB_SV-5-814 [hydrothermal vent metagenome]|uniref:Outer membrane protein beta-barrel domain-containing protein n=1 Tax=hydrothermal vent metagenome TaxID=652676 RepID=A0A1W1ECK9_9ZZZZ